MNYRDKANPPMKGMLWSDKHAIWLWPDTRPPHVRKRDEWVAKQFEERAKMYRSLNKRFEPDVFPLVDVGVGWSKIVFDLVHKLDDSRLNWTISRITQKDGQLVFHAGVTGHDVHDVEDRFFKYVRKAEEKSLKTCEFCGKPGEPQDVGGYIATACTECAEEIRKHAPKPKEGTQEAS